MTTLWTYIVLVTSIASFDNAMLERTWMYAAGPFQSKEVCERQKINTDTHLQVSQCMPDYIADGLIQPYNNHAVVLYHDKKSKGSN